MPKRPQIVKSAFSLMSRGLREKMIVAFCLMSVVPLLVLVYIVTTYATPYLKTWWDVGILIGIAAGISVLGFVVTRSFVLPVVRLAEEAKTIAEGKMDQRVEVTTEDEIGALGKSLNEITHRVRENMAQLQVYGEETRHLHLEINRRIVTFSNLLQISNLITQSAKVEEIVAFILEKLSHLEEVELNLFIEPSSSSDLFVVRMAMGADRSKADKIVNVSVSLPLLQRYVSERKTLVLDANTGIQEERDLLCRYFGIVNVVCQPLVGMGKVIGVLVCGNSKENFTFGDDLQDILKVFAKQMAIAIENDLLVNRAKKLEILDDLTGLYNARYSKNRLEEEIRRSMRFHHPCSLMILNIDGFGKLQERHGQQSANKILAQVADVIRGELNDVDRVGRIGPDEFCVILPERNKREAIQLAERIRKKIETGVFVKEGQKILESLTISGGISENPLDGSTSEELFNKATELMKLAKGQGRNRINPALQGHTKV